MQEHLWVEKYRPSTLQDIILPSQLKKDFELIVKQRELQNMLLTGTAGTGKTTVAKALCKMLNSNSYSERKNLKLDNLDSPSSKILDWLKKVF